jgi:hypothetical protein
MTHNRRYKKLFWPWPALLGKYIAHHGGKNEKNRGNIRIVAFVRAGLVVGRRGDLRIGKRP